MLLQSDPMEDILLIFDVISIVVVIVTVIVSARMAARYKTNTLIFFFLTWLIFIIYAAGEVLEYMLLSPLYLKINNSFILSTFFITWMLFLDFVMLDRISWQKMCIAGAVTAFLVTFMWIPKPSVFKIEIIENASGIQEMAITKGEDLFYMVTNLVLVILLLFYFYWTTLTFIKSPKQMKKSTVILFMSGFLGILATILVFLGDFLAITSIAPDLKAILQAIASLCQVFSLLIATIIIYKNPKITHLLPYKVQYLIVTDKAGTPFYDHRWVNPIDDPSIPEDEKQRRLIKKENEKILFAGLLTALDTITKNTMKSGDIREIQLRNGVFLMNTWLYTINVGLLASKTSKGLRESLDQFTAKFEDVFSSVLRDENGNPTRVPKNLTIFEEADDLVSQAFPNIPYYDEKEEIQINVADDITKEALKNFQN
ncbi:MAG: hypothetical protein ACTSWN_04660 [Promethearchaeota archaeon]